MKTLARLTAMVFVLLSAACAEQGRPPATSRPLGRPLSRPASGPSAPAPAAAAEPRTVRCVVIGGMMETGFWEALSERFENSSGIRVSVVASGNKAEIAPAFAAGKADLITMHACDAIINLVADGYATDARPWARNDMLIVGPPDDPARIKGMTDATAALRKIAEAGSPFVVHSSLGAQEVLRALLDAGDVTLAPENTTVLLSDRARQVVQIAADRHAYTLVGRIPFLDHKLGGDGLVTMVQGDPRLRRPFLVAVADPAGFPGSHVAVARKLASFLLEAQTQAWIADYGRGRRDDQPLFFPVATNGKDREDPGGQ